MQLTLLIRVAAARALPDTRLYYLVVAGLPYHCEVLPSPCPRHRLAALSCIPRIPRVTSYSAATRFSRCNLTKLNPPAHCCMLREIRDCSGRETSDLVQKGQVLAKLEASVEAAQSKTGEAGSISYDIIESKKIESEFSKRNKERSANLSKTVGSLAEDDKANTEAN